MDYSGVFVCLMGMGTVFFGLVCLIVLISIMGRIARKAASAKAIPAPAPAVPERVDAAVVAAVSAAVAEELGTDITGIRILSIKRV